MAFGFPAGVDPIALDNASYSTLAQAGMGFSQAFSNVAALGGAPGASLSGGLGSATSGPGGAQALQLMMAQAIMQNYQFLGQIWKELGTASPASSLQQLASLATPDSPK